MMRRPHLQARHLEDAHAVATVANGVRTEKNPLKRMRPSQEGVTILIVDNDLGFVYWLGCTLSAAGYLALPAFKCEDATDLVNRLNIGVDLLVVDTSMPGATELVEALEGAHHQFKVIAVKGYRREPDPIFQRADACQDRGPCADDDLEAAWLDTVRGVIAADGIESGRLLPD
jgi:CheY-like chemotaxis protein